MSETLRYTIITSPSAEKMLGRVSPIYDNSYVGLWLFEAIGREYDGLREIVDTFPDQLFPQSVTWAIELWEQRYGITPRPSQALEERRAAIKAARAKSAAFTPFVLEQYIYNLTGRQAEVVDHIDDFTFGVYIDNTDGMRNAIVDDIEAYINKNKHSHMSYNLAFQGSSNVIIGIETGYWRFSYRMTDTAKTGQLPQTNIRFAESESQIDVENVGTAYLFPYTLSGTSPEVNISASGASADVDVGLDAQPYVFPYPAAGDCETGERPQYNVTGNVESSSIRASPVGKAFSICYAMCGATKAGIRSL